MTNQTIVGKIVDRQSIDIRVAKNLEYGHRYVVAMRNLKNAQGEAIEAGPAFRIYRDNHESGLAFVNERRLRVSARRDVQTISSKR